MAQEYSRISNSGERRNTRLGENRVKSALSVSVALCLGALALAGCQKQEASPAPEASTSAPDSKPGISVSDAILTLPVVAGRPGAAYFTVVNNGDTPTSLAAVHIDGVGKTEMHETKGGKMEAIGPLEVGARSSVTFERGGKHVMAFDLDDAVASKPTVELTLIFSDGDKVWVPMKVEKITDMGGGMSH